MKIFQSRLFLNKLKKFTPRQRASLDSEIRKIAENPSLGAEKKGDLRGVFVHKFKMDYAFYLLAYRFTEGDLELITIGFHQYDYRDLKSYLRIR